VTRPRRRQSLDKSFDKPTDRGRAFFVRSPRIGIAIRYIAPEVVQDGVDRQIVMSTMAECPEQTPEGELASRVPVLLPIAFHGFGHLPGRRTQPI
jgi:hypothetical protein